ncbi:MAG: polysaccharide biosynthesis tyrosine autokinase [Prevotella sp.]|jgi:capsular exopolysaccharide synthesis family protein|nr:polysaccharide biosynthesis tyrosine autokinase [Prevotella sp.]MCI2080011.1 polysaccharide biosynthesis tyrosine autokinase [Prevotella sp.]MCI2101813.1 polysaccharide biosynthesis tyrosine autokinase [Prevotella sp.]
MEDNKYIELESSQEQGEKSSFDFQTIYTTLVLNWKWFLLSLIICLGSAAIYLRYSTKIYQATEKLLIKDDETSGRRGGANNIQNVTNLGFITNSNGIDNEMEILTSHSLAAQTVRDLKLYVNYKLEGRVKDHLLYRTQPITVDIDPSHLEKIAGSIQLTITPEGNNYHVIGQYYVSVDENSVEGPFFIDKSFSTMPATIGTRAGVLSFTANTSSPLKDGRAEKVTIVSPTTASYKYVAALTVNQTSKTTTIAQLTLKDEIPQRAIDYLKQLVICYNEQANDDKNEIARRTEEFINGRLEKINAELGNTEGQLSSYKRANNVVDVQLNAGQALQNQGEYDQKLNEANTQVALINSLSQAVRANKEYQVLPVNVGIADASVNDLISKYNEIALQRNRLLQSASENSPTVTPLTSQLDELNGSIRRAMDQAKRNVEIQRGSVASQYNKYASQTSQSPEEQRILGQIGRQQEVKSGLYLMLLQKREENSISLAATADKGRLIDDPQFTGKISPKSPIVLLIALILGIAIPSFILFLIQFFRYKIDGHEDVVKLTNLPILADVAVASETAKTKADIVVHENQNNLMEEIFRSMRTNLQFLMKENEKVIMFTSTTSGEGKTFNAANLAVSFALLGKKVILVGLDIRKPRLAELFEIDDHHHGITQLLMKEHPTEAEVKSQIVSSGIHNNLDLLMAGPIPPNPSELVARTSLEDIMEVLKKAYDYVLIDTVPVGLVTDTLQIARIANATVYMCRADYTARDSFNLINGLYEEKKLPNMSIVINGIDMSKKKNGYRYGYGKYGKYGRYGHYGNYGSYHSYKSYGSYGTYGSYGNYSSSHYGDKNDTSIKR